MAHPALKQRQWDATVASRVQGQRVIGQNQGLNYITKNKSTIWNHAGRAFLRLRFVVYISHLNLKSKRGRNKTQNVEASNIKRNNYFCVFTYNTLYCGQKERQRQFIAILWILWVSFVPLHSTHMANVHHHLSLLLLHSEEKSLHLVNSTILSVQMPRLPWKRGFQSQWDLNCLESKPES